MKPLDLASHVENVAGMCHDATPAEWSAYERDVVLRSLTTISYEIPSLSARIRAAKVNDTPVPHPVKPGPKPVDPPSQPDPPPPPPPTEDQSGPGEARPSPARHGKEAEAPTRPVEQTRVEATDPKEHT